MRPSDVVLLERWASSRDAEAFNEIVARYSGLVYGTCKRVLGSSAQAEDVAQECFLGLAEAGKPIRTSLGGWLHRVATNKSLNALRADSRRRAREQRFAEEAACAGEADWGDIQVLVDEAIEGLPESSRGLIIAHFLEGRTHEAIAQDLGLTRQAVGYRVKKGVEEVRAALRKRGISVGVAALGAGLASEAAQAAPAGLTAALGKLALAGGSGGVKGSGVAVAAQEAAKWAGVLMMKKLAIVLGALAIVALGIWIGRGRGSEPMEPESATAEIEESAALEVVPPEEEAAEDAAPVVAEKDAESREALAGPEEEGLGSISGRVYDAESGEGIPEVHVRAYLDAGEPLVKAHGTSAPSDAAGCYEISGLPSGRFLIVPDGLLHEARYLTMVSDEKRSTDMAGAAGYPPQKWAEVVCNVNLGEGEHVQGVDLRFDRTCICVAGIVLSAEGEPIEGALVGFAGGGLPNARQMRSRAGGRFEWVLDSVAAGLFVVARTDTAESALLGPLEVPKAGLSGIELRLDQPRKASISGIVVDRFGRPASGVSVYLSRGKVSEALGLSGVNRGASADDGSFLIGGLAAGRHGVVATLQDTAWLPVQRDVAATVELAQGQALTGLEVVCDEVGGLSISGRIVDEAGNPVSAAAVSCRGPAGLRSTSPDSQGRFSLKGLKEGTYEVVVNASDYSSASVEGVPAGSEGIEIVLHGTGVVEGRVVRADTGVAISEFEVACRPSSGPVLGFAPRMLSGSRRFHDAEGQFRLEHVNIGEAIVAARADGWAPAFQTVLVAEGRTSGGIELRLSPGVRVEGQVVSGAGEPIAGAGIYMAAINPELRHQQGLITHSDAGGRFEVAGLSPDIDRLWVEHPDYGAAQAPVSPRMQVVLSEAGTIQGKVTVNGAPLPDVDVLAISRDDPGSFHRAKTRLDGTYEIAKVAPGQVSVLLDPKSGWSRDASAIVEAGQAAWVAFELVAGTAVIEGCLTVGGEIPQRAAIALSLGEKPIRSAIASSEGLYRLDKLPAGRISLIATALDAGGQYLEQRIELDVGEGETIRQDIDIQRSGGPGRIVGRIAAGEGMRLINVAAYAGHWATEPISGLAAIREVCGQWGTRAAFARCGDDGSFEIQGLEPGDFTVGINVVREGANGQAAPEDFLFISANVTVGETEPAMVEIDLR